jgi:hypothetical protein
VLHYEGELRAGRFAMMTQGNPEDVQAAHRLLEAAGAIEVRDHGGREEGAGRPA